MSYLCEERTSEDARQDVGRSPPERRPVVDRFTNYRPKLGRRPPLYRPSFARLPLVYWRAPGDFWSLVFEGHRPSPVQNVTGYISSKKNNSTPWRIWHSATFGRSTISAGDRWICDVGIRRFYFSSHTLLTSSPCMFPTYFVSGLPITCLSGSWPAIASTHNSLPVCSNMMRKQPCQLHWTMK